MPLGYRPYSLKNVGLTKLESILPRKALLHKMANQALAPKMFRRATKSVLKLVAQRLSKGKFGSEQFYSIKKRKEWLKRRHTRKKWRRNAKMLLNQSLSNLFYKSEVNLRNKLFFTRDRLKTRYKLKALKTS
jgi:hypothetical protein